MNTVRQSGVQSAATLNNLQKILQKSKADDGASEGSFGDSLGDSFSVLASAQSAPSAAENTAVAQGSSQLRNKNQSRTASSSLRRAASTDSLDQSVVACSWLPSLGPSLGMALPDFSARNSLSNNSVQSGSVQAGGKSANVVCRDQSDQSSADDQTLKAQNTKRENRNDDGQHSSDAAAAQTQSAQQVSSQDGQSSVENVSASSTADSSALNGHGKARAEAPHADHPSVTAQSTASSGDGDALNMLANELDVSQIQVATNPNSVPALSTDNDSTGTTLVGLLRQLGGAPLASGAALPSAAAASSAGPANADALNELLGLLTSNGLNAAPRLIASGITDTALSALTADGDAANAAGLGLDVNSQAQANALNLGVEQTVSAVSSLAGATAQRIASGTGSTQATSTTSSTSGSDLLNMDQTNWATDLVAKVTDQLAQSRHEAKLELHPQELGSMMIRISLQGAAAQVQFVADNPATRQALQNSMPQLQQLLAQAGLSLSQSGVGSQFSHQSSSGQSSWANAQTDAQPRAGVQNGVSSIAAVSSAQAGIGRRNAVNAGLDEHA